VNYKQARRYIEDAAQAGITLGLDNIKNLLNELGNPQDELKFIHIAGTNGKGSVLAYISTIMEMAGYMIGCYISPTVQSYRERIQVNRTPISKGDFSSLLSKIKKAIDKMLDKGLSHPSVFEIETVLGFLYFKQEGCEIVVMETGMGGRTDATNIIRNPLVSVFTSISYDHMEFLGNTISDLTRAKAGIIKEGSHVVYGRLPAESEEIIKATAKHLNNSIHIVNLADIVIQKSKQRFTQTFCYRGLDEITIHLIGKHQIENATLAIEAVRVLQGKGFNITDDQIKAGLRKTRWFARVTVVKEKNPVIIVDGAHNQDAVRALTETLVDLFPTEKIVGVMGVFKDKEIKEMLAEIKPVMRKIHTISLPDKKRTLPAKQLKELVLESGIEAESHDVLVDALNASINEVGTDGVVVAFGSLSYLGEVLQYV
jgi:dihydrofolate synthase/folylpolyglutamate synthase